MDFMYILLILAGIIGLVLFYFIFSYLSLWLQALVSGAISTDNLESHFLAGGNVSRVVQALITADKANIELTFNRAVAIDLAGRDVLEAVQM